MLGVVIFLLMIITKNVRYLFLHNFEGACSPYFLLCFNFVLIFYRIAMLAFSFSLFGTLFVALGVMIVALLIITNIVCFLNSSQFSQPGGSFFIFWFCFALPFCFYYGMVWGFSIFLVGKLLFWYVLCFRVSFLFACMSLFTSMSPTWVMPFPFAFLAYIVLTWCLFLHLTLIITTSCWHDICFCIVHVPLLCFYSHLPFFLHHFFFVCLAMLLKLFGCFIISLFDLCKLLCSNFGFTRFKVFLFHMLCRCNSFGFYVIFFVLMILFSFFSFHFMFYLFFYNV